MVWLGLQTVVALQMNQIALELLVTATVMSLVMNSATVVMILKTLDV